MERSVVWEMATTLWDAGQRVRWVSPGIQKAINTFEARMRDPALSDAQRNVLANMAFCARILGGLQIVQVVSGDKPPRRKLRRRFISSSLTKESKA